MRTLVSIWSWLAILLLIISGFVVQLVVIVLAAPFDRNRWLTGRTFRRSAIIASWLVPSWRFGTFGQVPRRIKPHTVVVSNHCSNADPFLISRLPWEMKWLGKAELFRIPILGWSMYLSGDIPVQRGEKESQKVAIARCKRWLDRGMPVIFFPEGTRSKTGELQPFKDGAFRLAVDEQADLLPIAVAGTRDALPKHSWKFGKNANARVAVGTPISTAGLGVGDIERLKAEVRAQMETLIGQMAPEVAATG